MPKTTKKTKTATTHTAPTAASEPTQDVYRVKAQELVEKLKEILAEGNARRIIITDKNDTVLFTIPVTFGVLGALVAPALVGVGLVAAVVGECTIKVEK